VKFQRSHPLRGSQIEVGWFKLVIFEQHVAISQKQWKVFIAVISVCNFWTFASGSWNLSSLNHYTNKHPVCIWTQGHESLKIGNPSIFKSCVLRHLQWELATDHGFLNYYSLQRDHMTHCVVQNLVKCRFVVHRLGLASYGQPTCQIWCIWSLP